MYVDRQTVRLAASTHSSCLSVLKHIYHIIDTPPFRRPPFWFVSVCRNHLKITGVGKPASPFLCVTITTKPYKSEARGSMEPPPLAVDTWTEGRFLVEEWRSFRFHFASLYSELFVRTRSLSLLFYFSLSLSFSLTSLFLNHF